MPFLTVFTRTHPRPVEFLHRNVYSLRQQTDRDYEQIVLRDEVGRGLGWANAQFYANRHRATGEYVLMMDDDNVFVTNLAIAALKLATWDRPDAVIFRASVGPHGVLPSAAAWEARTPIAYQIDGHCCIVRRDVWLEHVQAFATERMGDWAFYQALFAAGGRVEWVNMVLIEALRVGSMNWQAAEVA